jgi:protein SCO1/2
VVYAFYADELRAFLRSRAARAALSVPVVFAGLGVSLLATGELSASGVPPTAATVAAPLRDGKPAPDFDLVDHRGAPVSLATLRGRPVAMTFVYAGCHASCPLLVARLKALEARTPDDVAFVAVTLDPARDTVAALAAAAGQWELGPRWHLLTGTPEAVARVLRDYAVQRVPLPDGEIAHDNVVLLLDRRARVAWRYRGLAQPADRQAADLARLVAERG